MRPAGPGQTGSWLRRPVWRTLRFRLTVWNTLLVAFTAAATAIALREGVRLALLDELEAILRSDLQEIVLTLQEMPSTRLPQVQSDLLRKAVGHQRQGWYVELLDERQEVLWSSQVTLAEQGGFEPPLFEVRTLSRHDLPGPGQVRGVRVGASLDFLQRDLARMDRLVLTVGGVAVLIAPFGGYWLARQGIRPLTDMTATAAHIAPYPLKERLPLRNSGDELDRLSLTINHLLDRIAVYLQQRRDLLANSAHELRSPLAAIRSSAEVALDRQLSAADYQELLSDVIVECTSLEVLVNQLLVLAEAETERLRERHERVSLSDIVQRAVGMFSAAAELSRLRFQVRIEAEVVVVGHRPHLKQVVNNLLDNAIKFTPAEGTVTVQLERDAAAGEARLIVSDTGSGIAPEDLTRVFERFYRGDKARRREGGGTGLGLSICKSVVEGHGGTIDLSSRLLAGTTATVHLPLAP